MKVKTIQVLWHAKVESTAGAPKPAPVLSVDFDPATGRLVTGGADKEVKLWSLKEDADGNPDVEHLETLTAHTKAVNVVRFSPGGDILASGGDTGEVLLWRRAPEGTKNLHGDPTTWRTANTLRGHSDDVQDLAWAPGGAALVTGSVDNSSIVWSEATARGLIRLEGHEHYVQGVAWDPQGEFVVSASGDRKVNVYATTPRSRVPVEPDAPRRLVQEAGVPEGGARAVNVKGLLFHDDTLESFSGDWPGRPAGLPRDPRGVAQGGGRREAGARARRSRRLPLPARQVREAGDSSSVRRPRGVRSLLTASVPKERAWRRRAPRRRKRPPGGRHERRRGNAPPRGAEPAVDAAQQPDGEANARRRGAPRRRPAPAADDAAAVTVEPAPDFDLPYRVVFAVCTTDTVAVYDTGADAPVAFVSGLHYATITDAAWSPCGLKLVVSSSARVLLGADVHGGGAGTRARARGGSRAHRARASRAEGQVRGGEGEARGGGGEGGGGRSRRRRRRRRRAVGADEEATAAAGDGPKRIAPQAVTAAATPSRRGSRPRR